MAKMGRRRTVGYLIAVLEFLRDHRSLIDRYIRDLRPNIRALIDDVRTLDRQQFHATTSGPSATFTFSTVVSHAKSFASAAALFARGIFRAADKDALIRTIPRQPRSRSFKAFERYLKEMSAFLKKRIRHKVFDHEKLDAFRAEIRKARALQSKAAGVSRPLTRSLNAILSTAVKTAAAWVQLVVALSVLAGHAGLAKHAPRQPQRRRK